MKAFIQLFNKANGKNVLKQFLYGHVLIYSIVMALLLGFDKKSLEIMREAVTNKQVKRIRKSYKKFIGSYLKKEEQRSQIQTLKAEKEPRKIWVCWLQGMDKAPQIVKMCYQSLCDNITDREIVVITEENYHMYVQFPDFIQKKIETGIISRTHMSDLLRLELLIHYGGTWIDSTVFCSGKYPEYMIDSELFMFQKLKPGLDGHATSISNWFITAGKNNKVLKLTLSLMYDYWKKNNNLVNYFIFHYFFQIAIETYPEEWNKVVPVCNSASHILLLRLFNQYNEDVWNAIKEQIPFHKLTYKFTEEQTEIEETYYKVLFK